MSPLKKSRKSKITKTIADKLLARVPEEKAFTFYMGADQPLGKVAYNLEDFHKILSEVGVDSISYHINRDDFKNWLEQVIGDEELAAKLVELKKAGLNPEELKSKFYSQVDKRLKELTKLSKKK